ncbi:50S ribosomal protein L11 methyltransferase [Lactovum miscens]|uniref:Ribosomal protein L11 methyltransferase n=1 Tax=Lactovum miscens TaxID=190387 RepID=A0A841C3E6_9LACT|nr:50S ribosomal protein L11 methyltransferase [Lactovum miscens]MBB5887353.1 ribosomal protein L11 methyltransferase [Lactovum miscens]
MNNWIKITINVSRETEEIITAILVTAGSGGVEISDSLDYLDLEVNHGENFPEVEQLDTIEVAAYFPEEIVTQDFISGLRDKISEFGRFELKTDSLAEEEWANAWKKYFVPTRISRYLTIVPSWTDYVASGRDEKLINLDPGMAFGTGTHPTTRLSLWALEEVLRGGEILFDVGTGSGVLSIVAAHLGAEDIYAYDLDDVAVRVAQENIELNPETKNKIHVGAGNLLQGVTQTADVIVANILAEILLLMIDDAYKLLNPEGTLILSGIIDNKRNLVLEKALNTGFQLEASMLQGQWNCLILKKTETELFFG